MFRTGLMRARVWRSARPGNYAFGEVDDQEADGGSGW